MTVKEGVQNAGAGKVLCHLREAHPAQEFDAQPPQSFWDPANSEKTFTVFVDPQWEQQGEE